MAKSGRVVTAVTALALALLVGPWEFAQARDLPTDKCRGGVLTPQNPGDDLLVTKDCVVGPGTYKWGNINILADGTLNFADAKIDFWAKSILVENGGRLIAGTPPGPGQPGPIGTQGGVVTIHLYGDDKTGDDPSKRGQGIVCVTDARCGIPQDIWDSNGPGKPPTKMTLRPSTVNDYFYPYEPLIYDDAGDTKGFFGYKVLAVSYGGTLQLYGKKGASYDLVDPFDSGSSWVRLDKTLRPGDTTLTLDRAVDWEKGDRIVVTTTDYLPGHSEELTISEILGPNMIRVEQPIKYGHWGEQYDLSRVPAGQGPDFASDQPKVAETRAAVALLTRSIRIVSEGDTHDCPVGQETCFTGGQYFFGGHTIVRQGVLSYQVQGVEFYQLGQGGRMGHYPVHFHMARATPPDTFVKDASVHDSMTRWITLHSTHNVTLARNVGYLSIGHGFYLEDGTEIDNKLYSNIGVFARGAVMNADGSPHPQNPRKVPGILAAPDLINSTAEVVPKKSDVDHPTVFWFLNGWNDFQGNMAAGAGTCGACYWFVPATNSGRSDDQVWEGYASIQAKGRRATSPLKSFVGNYCTTAMNSFNTVDNTAPCIGVGGPDNDAHLSAVPNKLAPGSGDTAYYPRVGGLRAATRCNQTDCSQLPPPCNSDPNPGAPAEQNCMVTALDRYTSAFHWTETNFAAIWLRPQWYLMTNSVLSDVQNGGLTFVTGGDFTRSSAINGHWALARKNVFIGNVQPITAPPEKPVFPENAFASQAGPFNPAGLACDNGAVNYCISLAEGVSFPLSSFGLNQRLFSIYDGPAFQESNAYLDVTPTVISDCHSESGTGRCDDSKWMYGRVLGMPKEDDGSCYLPNAAIAWKQPNGFYYPPTFHSAKLFFDPERDPQRRHSVKYRHFVIEPLFQPGGSGEPGTFLTDLSAAKDRYCTWNSGLFDGYTDIDRQTELTDNDGSLTGYQKTISVNLDPFFNAPVEAIECASDATAKTSPHEYVTTVLYPGCTQSGASPRFSCGSPEALPPVCTGPEPSHLAACRCEGDLCDWARPCTNQHCFGVPLFRQFLTQSEKLAGSTPSSRMMGEDMWQRNTLTANHGSYYIDTTAGREKQRTMIRQWFPGTPVEQINVNVFKPGETYYVFFLFATPTTKQTYQMYVGKDPAFNPTSSVGLALANITGIPVTFTAGPWPEGQWTRTYDANTGILTVTADMGIQAFKDAYAKTGAERCRPFSFCGWNADTNKCGCAASLTDYPQTVVDACNQKNSAGDDAICSWAVKDYDCPSGGCFGFSVTLPQGFRTDPATNPLTLATSGCFPRNADWDVSFTPANPAAVAGSCANSPIEPAQFCQ